jgi:hypothetical protein
MLHVLMIAFYKYTRPTPCSHLVSLFSHQTFHHQVPFHWTPFGRKKKHVLLTSAFSVTLVPRLSPSLILLQINTVDRAEINLPDHTSHSKLRPINLVSICRCSSSPHNPLYTRPVDPSALVISLSSHRHSYIGLLSLWMSIYRFIISIGSERRGLVFHDTETPILTFSVTLTLSIHNKQTKTVTRAKIIHYRQVYLNRPDPIVFMSVAVDTSSGRIYDDFSRLLFLHDHREASALANELPEESGQFRFLCTACLANLKGSVGLILAKASAMRISIPLDLSSRPFILLLYYRVSFVLDVIHHL